LSGYGMEADLAESKAAGFQIHITKPVDVEQLIEAIDEVLRKQAV
jgi:CheY-like chemotaxis protein